MPFLENIKTPADIKTLSHEQLQALCNEIRQCILETTAENGGHTASNLGCVELTVALHRVFDIPQNPLIFDVGHQSYTHKLLTGRYNQFKNLRKTDGISGFASPFESEFDTGMSGHSGSAISLACGIAQARHLRGVSGKVLAVVGDASIGNGVSFEGMNADFAGKKNLIVILNDNRMSISQNVGYLSKCLNGVSTARFYNRIKSNLRSLLSGSRRRQKLRNAISNLEDSIKGAILPQASFFQSLGFRYIGPVDGHDIPKLEMFLNSIKDFKEPVLLHVYTEKGHGCEYVSKNPTAFHGVSRFNKETGEIPKSKAGFAAAFGQFAMQMAQKHPDFTIITPAMTEGAGLTEFAKSFPKQFYDAGIAEEHAVIYAAGMATAGMRPVCTIYTTFAQRALDCIYSDIVLPQLPVVLAFDRAGFVSDGPTHHGIYDLGFLRSMPNLDIICPRDEFHLQAMLKTAWENRRPAVVRYPRGGTGIFSESNAALPTIQRGKAAILRESESPDVVIWALGTECKTALDVAAILEQNGKGAIVIDAQWLAPFDIETARKYANFLQVTIEDHSIHGGLADALNESLENIPHAAHLRFGWSDAIIPFGNADEIKSKYGLTPDAIATKILK